MDMFVKVFDIEVQEFIYINKNIIDTVSVDMVNMIVGLVLSGAEPTHMYIKLQNTNDVHEFMKAVEGMVYKVPKASIKTKAID